MSETVTVNVGGTSVNVLIEGGALAVGASVAYAELNTAVGVAVESAADAQEAAAIATAAAASIPAQLAGRALIDGSNIISPATFLANIGGANTSGSNLGASSQTFVQALGNYPTRALAVASSIVAVLSSISLYGYATAGDWGGPVSYVRTGANPGNNAGFQTADGQWWKPSVAHLTPEIFGAKGDNSTDDSAAWQNCVNYAAVVGLDVRPPSRSYPIGTVVGVPDSVRIDCAGRSDKGTVFRSTTASGTVFRFDGDFISLRGFQCRSTASKTGGAYIDINGRSNCVVDDFYLYNGFIGIDLKGTNASFNRFSNGYASTFRAGTGVVIKIDTNGVETSIFNIATQHDPANKPLANIQAIQCGDVSVINCNLLQAVNSVYLAPTAGKAVSSFKVLGGYLDSSSCALRAEGLGGDIVRCSMTQVWNGGGSLISGGGNGVILRNTGGGTCSGFDMIRCEVPLVTNGVDWDSGWTDVNIANSTLSQCGGTAVVVGNNATRWSLSDSTIAPSNGLTLNNVGLSIGTGCNAYKVVGNRIFGNTTNYVNGSTGATDREISGNIGLPNQLRIGSGVSGENYTVARKAADGFLEITPEQAGSNGVRVFVRSGGGSTSEAFEIDNAGRATLPFLVGLSYASDAAAAAAGVRVGGLYHTSGTVKVRTV